MIRSATVNHILCVLLAFALAWPMPGNSGRPRQIEARRSAGPGAASSLYIPLVLTPATPAGTYDCNEFEFGSIWTTEVITLTRDGGSVYAYMPPYGGVVTGTWTYDPQIQEVGFTNFRWSSATFLPPDVLTARRYLPDPGFEIGLGCTRRRS